VEQWNVRGLLNILHVEQYLNWADTPWISTSIGSASKILGMVEEVVSKKSEVNRGIIPGSVAQQRRPKKVSSA
jgi:hypothetical protein